AKGLANAHAILGSAFATGPAASGDPRLKSPSDQSGAIEKKGGAAAPAFFRRRALFQTEVFNPWAWAAAGKD
ncbi:MAG: hypothetical protein WCF84_21570, partial [Anaerolineae bacterium]